MNGKNIVVIEDEPDILEVLNYNLKREGYSVFTSMDGAGGLTLIQSKMPDLVLLDLMLPGMDGLDICRHLKNDQRTRHIAIVMVTAKGTESDVVLGLELGADDYITKPFSPRELVARVSAVLRRANNNYPHSQSDCLRFDGLNIDARKHQVSLHGTEVKFTATEFRILYYLASHPGQVFSRDQILDRALGTGTIVVDRNIDVHIRAVRKKLADEQEFIETIRGVGYRFKDAD